MFELFQVELRLDEHLLLFDLLLMTDLLLCFIGLRLRFLSASISLSHLTLIPVELPAHIPVKFSILQQIVELAVIGLLRQQVFQIVEVAGLLLRRDLLRVVQGWGLYRHVGLVEDGRLVKRGGQDGGLGCF